MDREVALASPDLLMSNAIGVGQDCLQPVRASDGTDPALSRPVLASECPRCRAAPVEWSLFVRRRTRSNQTASPVHLAAPKLPPATDYPRSSPPFDALGKIQQVKEGLKDWGPAQITLRIQSFDNFLERNVLICISGNRSLADLL